MNHNFLMYVIAPFQQNQYKKIGNKSNSTLSKELLNKKTKMPFQTLMP